jgi:hypothetical protein
MTPENSAPAMAPSYVLLLDADMVYRGARLLTEGETEDGKVVLDHKPDNAPGRYKWSAAENRLEPLPVQKDGQQSTPPLQLNAIALGFMAIAATGISLPEGTKEWLRWYAQSVDFGGEVRANPDLVRPWLKGGDA